MMVEPNGLYLMPAKKEMVISDGKLVLTDKDTTALRLPIDVFFRSLAKEVGSQAVGVVLSGTGSDGSRGIRAIREAGGLVLVQQEETAKFDGMPRAAIETGAVHYVLPPEEMIEALLDHSNHPLDEDELANLTLRSADRNSVLDNVFAMLRDKYAIDFSYYKAATITRRIDRRLSTNQVRTMDEYLDRLRSEPAELDSLYRDLLIGVTKFFRDTQAFDRLEQKVIPELIKNAADGDEVRIWVADCATGEEAYSMAIVLQEQVEAAGRPLSVKVFATDLHQESLDFASAGMYSAESVAQLAPARLQRFFTKRGNHYQVSKGLRQMIVFAPHNIIRDAPFTKLDLISCRNLLIYLEGLAQKMAISMFHFGLKLGGVLFLGPSETLALLADEFRVIDERWRLFCKLRDIRLPDDTRLTPLAGGLNVVKPGIQPITRSPAIGPDRTLLNAYDALLEDYVPPALLIKEHRELVHTFGDAGRYLQRHRH